MVNKAILIGNLGADPELRHTAGGTSVCELRIATSERVKGKDGEWQDKTEWHRVVLDGLGAYVPRCPAVGFTGTYADGTGRRTPRNHPRSGYAGGYGVSLGGRR